MVQFYANDALRASLKDNSIQLKDYKPAYGESACLDLYNTTDNILLDDPSKTYFVGTGLHLALPTNMVGLIFQRGSIVKTPLIHRAGVVDSGYTGEIFVAVSLLAGNKPYTIPMHSKLPFQLLVTMIDNQFCSIEEEDFMSFTKNAARKNNCIGSSDIV